VKGKDDDRVIDGKKKKARANTFISSSKSVICQIRIREEISMIEKKGGKERYPCLVGEKKRGGTVLANYRAEMNIGGGWSRESTTSKSIKRENRNSSKEKGTFDLKEFTEKPG